ncbi:hypothetical protein WNY37_00210 [Henriciella sp. AS95]|uniref:hypothetical protein n=1 Tax=Henriciella sp. AS95 TaxID=3135782 RepID=UPI00317C08C5
MSEQTIQAMLFVGACFAAIVVVRAIYVVVFYKSWRIDELLGFSDGGWETDAMRERRRDFWR